MRKPGVMLNGMRLLPRVYACLSGRSPTPGLPLITALAQDKDAIFDVVAQAIVALNDADRALLDFRGIERIPADAYLAVRNPDKQTP